VPFFFGSQDESSARPVDWAWVRVARCAADHNRTSKAA
jgi:hypothetical protein